MFFRSQESKMFKGSILYGLACLFFYRKADEEMKNVAIVISKCFIVGTYKNRS